VSTGFQFFLEQREMAVCYLVADAVMVVNKERGREVGLSRAFANVTVAECPPQP